MADATYEGTSLSGGAWDILNDMFDQYNLGDLKQVLKDAIISNGATNTNLITEAVRGSEAYKSRFKGNFDRVAAGKNWLSEGTYLYQEQMYRETMASYGASDLAKKENFDKFIANDVSPNELSARFSAAYDKVTNAVNSNDKALVDELRKMYPGVEDSDIAKTILLGDEGAQYLKTRLNVADVKAAQTEAGVTSALGAEFLASQGLSRQQARAGLAKVSEQQLGMGLAAKAFGESATDLQAELEKENLLGQTSKKSKGLASKARAQLQGVSGTAAGTIGSSKAGQI